VFLSATLVAVGFIGVAGAFAYAAQVSRLAGDSIVAEQIAAGTLAETRAAGYAALTNWHTYAGEQGTTGAEQTCGELLAQAGLPAAQAWLTVTDVQTDLKGVTVVIEWGAARPGGRVETETLMSPRF
jgi:hypothetical protein